MMSNRGAIQLAQCVVFFLLGNVLVRGQDVSVSPVQWADAKDAPDDLPVIKSKLRTSFPSELRGTTDIGYLIYESILDAKGRVLALRPSPTLTAYLAAETTVQQKWEFTPGKRDGKAVNSSVVFAVLFNPASAALNRPDASPRLLEVSLVTIPRPKDRKIAAEIPDRLESAEIRIDTKGDVAEVVDAPAEFKSRIQIAMKNWRFAPAKKDGQEVEARIRVPVILRTAGGPTPKVTQQPRVVFQAPPIYPYAMRASGMRGEVVVDFNVDIEGRVRNAYVIRSLNPAFDDPAIDAVSKWRFEPAWAGDRPVKIHMQVPIVFALDGVMNGGGDGMDVSRKKADQSKWPEELRYDTPPKLRGSVRPVFPYAALNANREGRAAVRFLVDEEGRPFNAIVREATSPEFGQALLAAIEQFEYHPALKGGRPGKALLEFSQTFDRDEAFQLVSEADLDLLRREKKRPETIRTLREIDGKLTPLSQRPPKFPLTLVDQVEKGRAEIEFLVDSDGRVRLPRVINASHEAFGFAAVQGIAAWRFEPPTRGGRAVIVRVRIPVDFSLATKKQP